MARASKANSIPKQYHVASNYGRMIGGLVPACRACFYLYGQAFNIFLRHLSAIIWIGVS